VAAVALGLNTFRAAPAALPVQFTISYPPNVRPLSNGSDYHGASISPDGLRVAFSGADAKTGKIAVYVRRVDALEATMVKGTDGGRYPFWSPTNQTIAFYSRGKLNRVDLDGGSPLVICDAPTGGWGGSWNKDDVIVAGVNDPGPIVKVSAKGGDTPTPVTTLGAGVTDHDWPQFLPDGRHFIYTAWGNIVTGSAAYYIGSLDSQENKLLSKEVTHHSVAYADPGFVLFIREGSLMAQRLDLKTLALQGDARQVAANAGGPITASATGAVGYITTTQMAVWNRLAWINPDGTGERAITEPGFHADPAISPDGLKLAYAKKESFAGTYDIWIRDLATGNDRQLTFDPADDRSPVWSPASDEVVFSASRQPNGLYRKHANGVGAEVLITAKDTPQTWPYQWHPHGFITSHSDTGVSYDVFNLSLSDLKTIPLIHSSSVNEERGSVSPNGRWLSYDARETSRFEVFLTTYPPSASKLPVTTEGGAEAKWSRDGKELFYVNAATGALMVVTVTPGDPPTFGAPRQVHPGPLDWGWSSSHSFDIDAKTGRVVIEVVSATDDLTVLLNWQALLKK
jgi:Tol biopolymer transport system component